MHSPRLTHPVYRPDIDGLRAIAVLSVITFHFFPDLMRGGFVGVDVFFVISGYLISTIIFDNLDHGTFSFATFYARRILRIFPALILVLVACYAFGSFGLLADEYQQLGKHIFGGAMFVSNFVLSSEAGYFDTAAETKPLLHLWSLGVEEQFYILWPMLLWLARKWKANPLRLVLLIGVVSFCLSLYDLQSSAASAFFSPQTRFWELLSGAALAWANLHRVTALPRYRITHSQPGFSWKISRLSAAGHYGSQERSNVLSITGLLLLSFGFWYITRDYRFPGIWAGIPVLGAVLVIAAGSQAWVNRVLLSNRVLVWFGLISFPLYLWHWPLLSFARIVDGELPALPVRLTIVGLSVVLAYLTYRFIERPVRFGHRSTLKVVALLALMIAIGHMGRMAYRHHGYPQRASLDAVRREQEAMQGFGEDDPVTHAACMKLYELAGPIRYCNVSGPGKPHIALIGDSHARALYNGLKDELLQRNEGLLNIGGRLFLDLAVYPPGDKFEIEAYQGGIRATNFVAKEPSIDTVVMMSLGPMMLSLGDQYVFQLLSRPEIKDRKEIWRLAMRETLDALLVHKKNIVFVLDNPHIDFDPRSCLNGRPIRFHSTVRSPCAIPRTAFDVYSKNYRGLIFSILRDYPQVKVFDPAAYLCDQSWCWAQKDGLPLYLDTNHMSPAGARLLSRELVKVMDGQLSHVLD